ncbi:hypothetical protein HMN09_01104800 [Mycena chlorophos]|uniref:Uncharacterized protein n=1 Tax=Mycena chlorophos TaxID=658473 RepID=A0A8H6SCD6_MYCCL|nr:hypothetical protein HMN09_01104800 [Mycena chlorophos]
MPMSSSGPIALDPDFSPRNNPTCGDFAANRPVVKTIHLPRTQRSLNRPGRAIVRIVASYGWTAPKIARIFSVGVPLVQKVIANTAYNVQDDVSRDYEYAPAEYGVQFPPKGQKVRIYPPASILQAQSPVEDRYFPASFFESMIQSSLGPSQEPGIVSPSLAFRRGAFYFLNQTPSNDALAPLSLSQIAASEEHVWSTEAASSMDIELGFADAAQLELSAPVRTTRRRKVVPKSTPLSPTRHHLPSGQATTSARASAGTIADNVKLKRTRRDTSSTAQENVVDAGLAQSPPVKRPRTRRNQQPQMGMSPLEVVVLCLAVTDGASADASMCT